MPACEQSKIPTEIKNCVFAPPKAFAYPYGSPLLIAFSMKGKVCQIDVAQAPHLPDKTRKYPGDKRGLR